VEQQQVEVGGAEQAATIIPHRDDCCCCCCCCYHCRLYVLGNVVGFPSCMGWLPAAAAGCGCAPGCAPHPTSHKVRCCR
jgi:hypothetical protein